MAVLITGANKGIGFEIARNLALHDYAFDIIVSSRNVELGEQALTTLKLEFPTINFIYHQLDITDQKSRASIINFISEKYKILKVLINNAGFAYKNASKAPFSEQAKQTNYINYFGTKDLSNEMLAKGLFDENSRILNCSSGSSGSAYRNCNKNLQEALKNSKIESVSELDNLAKDFIKLAEHDKHKEMYANSAYGMSKLFLRELTALWARKTPNLKFYSYCPGWCKSDMAGWERPTKTAFDGSKVAVWLSLSNDKIITENNGGYFSDVGKLEHWGS